MKRLLFILALTIILTLGLRPGREFVLACGSEQFGSAFSENLAVRWLESLDQDDPEATPKDVTHEMGTTWELADDSEIDAVILAADRKTTQLRVLKTQGVAQVKLSLFSEPDRQKILSWVESEARHGVAGNPIPLKKHQWPREWRNRSELPLLRIDDTNRWKSEHFEITNKAGVNRDSLKSIVTICESVDGALRSLPLPLPVNWGRPTGERRQIVIEPENSPKAVDNAAGYWDPRTGVVHVFSEYLTEPDHQLVVFEFDKPRKLQKYDIIVHEITHQSTAALIYLDIPAWVPEGMAEYMAATQQSPASYFFKNTHVTLPYHINKRILGDRIVKERKLNLVHLEKLMTRDFKTWNRIVESGDTASELQYNQALLLVDYFCHRDHPNGLHFRRYLESVLSGVSEPEARARHLMRGRSYEALETAIVDLWQPLGYAINFQSRGEIKSDDVTFDRDAEEIKKTIASQRAMAQ
ncbi:MAG: hypothetical protein P1U68_09110 [Verrucomicrobiales bacterium]|nr:hypothetical protein [Verrucomicrobiales bacterium]